MDENEKNPPQKPQSDKRLKLDLSEALNQNFNEDDDIIELKDEVMPPLMAEKTKIDLNDQVNEDVQGDAPATEKIFDLDALNQEADDEENVARLFDDILFDEEDEEKENGDPLSENLAFEEEDEDDAEILPPLDEEFLKAEAANEVVEITEFDDILSDDGNEMMTLSDVDDELEPDEEFLELIDVEEDNLTEEGNIPETTEETVREEIEDDIIQFDGHGDDIEDAELEDFINDSIGEEIQIDDNFEDDLTNALGVEADSDINLSAPSSGTEEFDFDMDSSEISEKIDQLETIFFDESEAEDASDEDPELEAEALGLNASDTRDETDEISEKIDRLETFFSDESEAEAELDEDAESESEALEAAVSETGDETTESDFEITDVEPSAEPLAAGALTALAGASQEQIEKSIERIIKQNFSAKIDSMVLETIEKAVSKEIDRLKNILLEEGSGDNR